MPPGAVMMPPDHLVQYLLEGHMAPPGTALALCEASGIEAGYMEGLLEVFELANA
eukprot:CAMPEP_0202366318 /NCGR_PEP_ID=MMETSP1126-20121109/16979_1 /ASSEMBLY_ACC=CAM_ASM_000457 /TAXON_ID=3047 /ORGANISM="Dunaliella tertiolecta, Strain CCMP1320" /LENGTH=54 /DNA_ID=CAMNT_0048961347 /DNA_START=1369 /DNA_END=1534 /DNA_ORIENTATION=+